MQGSILLTKCTGLAYTVLLMDIDTKERGMREEGKVLECTASEAGKPSLVTGKMGFSMFLALRAVLILYLQWLCTILKSLMPFR